MFIFIGTGVDLKRLFILAARNFHLGLYDRSIDRLLSLFARIIDRLLGLFARITVARLFPVSTGFCYRPDMRARWRKRDQAGAEHRQG